MSLPIRRNSILKPSWFTPLIVGGRLRQKTIDYLEGLEKLAPYLADSPDLGMDRNTLIEGLISFPYTSHILYYIKQPHGITIIRVLHKRMDPKRHIMPGMAKSVDSIS